MRSNRMTRYLDVPVDSRHCKDAKAGAIFPGQTGMEWQQLWVKENVTVNVVAFEEDNLVAELSPTLPVPN